MDIFINKLECLFFKGKNDVGDQFTNPGTLKLPKEQIYHGGDSKSRNGRMQTMLRMVGFGDNAGSGFPAILMAWENIGWEMPELIEDTQMNQVTLILKVMNTAKEEPKGSRKGAKEEPKNL